MRPLELLYLALTLALVAWVVWAVARLIYELIWHRGYSEGREQAVKHALEGAEVGARALAQHYFAAGVQHAMEAHAGGKQPVIPEDFLADQRKAGKERSQ